MDPTQHRLTRRQAMQLGLAAAGSALAAGDIGAAPVAGKAKSVIQVWMWGGPCHIDTFDPKPGLGNDFNGPLDKAIATNVAGIQVGELLPELAKLADKYSIIRGMTHGINAHETAAYAVQTGRPPGGREVFPGLGAMVSLFKGAGYKGLIPPYVVLTELQGRFSESGFLGPKAKPFATGGDPAQARFAVEGIVAPGITEEQQRSRRELLHRLNTLDHALAGNPQVAALGKCEAEAYDLILGDAGKVFDLRQEKEDLRTRYGKNTFGQSCLMARRLVEKGVPFVTINYKGWDTHKQHFPTMRRKLPEMDRAMAALLQDLSDRGLLATTVVWWSGEFGRTPRVQWEAPWNGGRNHFGRCFCSVLAGGGFKGGHVVGATNATGEETKERPVYPADVLQSIVEVMGIDPAAHLPHPEGRPVPVIGAKADGVQAAGKLTEIM